MIDALVRSAPGQDHEALMAACRPGVGLCTVVGIDGSFSRRLGAQLAVLPDGTTCGNLADGCLEAQLAADIATLRSPRVIRYGRGSDRIDFRLPCGGGLDILLDPRPDRAACVAAMDDIMARTPTALDLPVMSPLPRRRYLPPLRIAAFGEGPELAALARLAEAMRIEIDPHDKSALALGRPAPRAQFDRWTAVLLLFHDHEWELALLEQALSSPAFFIGAQGGENARIARTLALMERGVDEEAVARIRSPVGTIPSCKTPATLALSALSQIVGLYEGLHASA